MKSSLSTKKTIRRALGIFLSLVMLFTGTVPFCGMDDMSRVHAATRLTLSAAKSLAVANSEKIESLDLQIDAKKAARNSAVRSLREKERSMGTFRWSPLLNFKFPTKPDEAEAFEFQFKPTQLDYNIKTLEHKITDQKLTEYESVSNIYIDIITYHAEITFLEERIKTRQEALLKNKARVAVGIATQDEVDQQEKTLDGLKSSLAKQKKGLLRAEEKLGKKIGFSVTSGYSFDEEFVSTNMDSGALEALEAYAIENDQTVYEARSEMELADLSLEINYDLMRQHYGSDINMISGYIEQTQAGSEVNKRAFKKDYDSFLTKIDEPWNGSWHILFFSIPKEWLKGDLDGVRYIEDDPYVLYTAALDYQAAVKEYDGACDELRSTIEDGYDAMMDARDAYMTAQKDLKAVKAQLIEAEAKNTIGTLSLEEYESIEEEYEDARSSLKDSLSTYSKSLYSFDKTTCGAASRYIAAEDLSSQAGYTGLGGRANGGDTAGDDLENMNAIIEKGATYSIKSIVSKEEFILYVDVPENFEYTITHYELWADKRQIGSRTAVGDSIRHLKIAVTEVDNVFIRLYNGTEFIDDCAIDPTASYGPLNITVGYEYENVDKGSVIGTFTAEDDTNIDMLRFRFDFDQTAVREVYALGAEVAYYNMAAEKSLYLFTNDLVAADQPFTYMSFIRNDLGKLTLRLFDANGSYIGGAKLDTDTGNLYADTEVTLSDMQDIAARQIVIREKSESLADEKKRLTDLYNAAESVNGGEADSATMEYYRSRLAEIEEQISDLSGTITDEDIDEARSTHALEIEQMVAEMGTDEQRDENGLTAAEIAARDAILYDAAKKVIAEKKIADKRAELEKTIEEYNKRLAEIERKLESATDMDRVNLIPEKVNLISERAVAVEKLDLLAGDTSSVTDQEISEGLLEYGDEIYSAAVDRLSDAMLYGSATGQWALAYLEAEGIETSSENMRTVVARVNDFKAYEDSINRRDTLQKEYDQAMNTYNKLKDAKDATSKSCAAQVLSISEGYKRELDIVTKQIAETDPGRDLKQK